MRIETEKKKKSKVSIEEKTRKKTYSTIFLLPAMKMDKKVLDKYGFVNCYWGDKGHDVEYKFALYILVEPSLDSDFKAFVEAESKKEEFLEDYDVGENQVMLVYKFPKQYEKEYKYFKVGEYSKFSKKYVEGCFPMTKKENKDGKTRTISSVFSGIFNKEEWLKEYWERKLGVDILPDEYWSVPDEKKEIFRS